MLKIKLPMRLLLFLLAALVFSCGSKEEITVLAAAGLKEPMQEAVKKFERTEGVRVNLVLGGSGELLVALGARGDLFVPAARFYFENAAERGLVDAKTYRVIAYHRPVLVVSREFASEVNSFEDLRRVKLRLGVGDPAAAAIGRVTERLFKNLNMEGVLKNATVKTPTVNQLLLYLKTGQIDAAVVWRELALKLEGVKVVEPPPAAAEREEVGAVLKKNAPERAARFLEFLLKERKLFKEAGFETPDGGG